MSDLPAPERLPAPSRLPEQAGLPDPFERFDGTAVTDPEDWPARRAELERLFRHYVYGYAPAAPALETTVRHEGDALDGTATLREIDISFPELPPDAPSIRLSLFLPPEEEAPVVLGVNRLGNHATVADDSVQITETAETAGAEERGGMADSWCVPYLLERGYGFATFFCADVDPDRDDFGDGIHPYFEADDLPGPAGTEWGTIAAWAWGVHRCVDCLVSADGVHEDGIVALGKSRRGKAVLLAGATDDRIGMVVPHQSGTCGTALSRDNGQETVARIARVFPHWFDDIFHGFGNREERLPVDQHLLLAMVAPRPLLDTAGSRDYWANPGRALDAVQAAAPVWEFLGETGIVDDGLVYEGQPIATDTVGRLCQFRRETGHTLERGYWEGILDFADLHLPA